MRHSFKSILYKYLSHTVAEKYSEFKKLGVELFSISIDSVFVHKMWNDHELLKMVNGGVP
jgi:peroxiredoxin (alkyl hydroperoxide reductase subunit C)